MTNEPPVLDGDEVVYFNLEGMPPPRRTDYHLRRVIWVNGMQVSPEDHKINAMTISKIIEGHVHGVYNRIGGVAVTLNDYIARIQASNLFAGQFIGGWSHTIEIPAPTNAPDPVQGFFNRAAAALGVPTKITFTTPSVPVKDLVVLALRAGLFLSPQTRWIVALDAVQGTLRAIDSPVQIPSGDVFQVGVDWVQNVLFGGLMDVRFSFLPVPPAGMPTAEFDRLRAQFGIQSPTLDLGAKVRAALRPMLRLFLQHNAATLSLFDLLDARSSSWPTAPLVIVCHSQGNLITSNALRALQVLNLETGAAFPPRALTVFAISSPAVTWPAGPMMRYYTHGDDPVTWLSLDAQRATTYSSRGNPRRGEYVHQQFPQKIGDMRTHRFENYVGEDPGPEGTEATDRVAEQGAIGTSQIARDLRTTLGLPAVPLPPPQPPPQRQSDKKFKGQRPEN